MDPTKNPHSLSHPLLNPSILPLSGAQPRSCYPQVLGSRVWKNKQSNWRNDKRVCLLLFPDPLQQLRTEGRRAHTHTHTHTHTKSLLSWDRTGVHVCGSDPGNSRNVEGQCQSSGRSTCRNSHTQCVPTIHHSIHVHIAHKYAHTMHIYAVCLACQITQRHTLCCNT